MVFSVWLSAGTLSAVIHFDSAHPDAATLLHSADSIDPRRRDGLDPTISQLTSSATLPLQGDELKNCVVGFEGLGSV